MSEKGQTTIEYLLVLVVSIGLGVIFTKKMGEYFVGNPNSYMNNQLKVLDSVLKTDPRFKRFRII